MTGRPAALSALAFASTASVADSEMADTRADTLVVGMLPWCHLPNHRYQPVSTLVRLGGAFGIHSGGCNRRAVAQLVESRSPKPAVGGSSPSCPASADRLGHTGPAGPRVVNPLAHYVRTWRPRREARAQSA